MTIHLGRPLPDASGDGPGWRRENPPTDRCPSAIPISSCSRWGLPCRPRRRGRGALLPHPFTLARRDLKPGRAVCFLWHFPWGRPRRALPGTVFPWSPDFPHLLEKTQENAAIQPSGRLNLASLAEPSRAETPARRPSDPASPRPPPRRRGPAGSGAGKP